MDDREKVLDVDDYCLRTPKTCDRDACPYYDFGDECLGKWLSDALKVLKAQEPIKPIKHLSTGQICGSCKKVLLRKYKYCPACGKAVKWK